MTVGMGWFGEAFGTRLSLSRSSVFITAIHRELYDNPHLSIIDGDTFEGLNNLRMLYVVHEFKHSFEGSTDTITSSHFRNLRTSRVKEITSCMFQHLSSLKCLYGKSEAFVNDYMALPKPPSSLTQTT